MSEITLAVETNFKKLLKEKAYRSITVKDICAGAHIGRNTFYANFRDKRAIIAYLFRRDAIEPFRNAVDALSLEVAHQVSVPVLQSFYRGIYDNREYYADLVRSMRATDDTFTRVVTRAIKSEFQKALEKAHYDGTETEIDFIAHYYGASQAIVLQKWINDQFSLSVEEIARLYSSMASAHWGQLFNV